jgi:hypothetical protein
MTTYRCIHCGGVTGSDEDALAAQSAALMNTRHGAGVCVPDENGLGEQWCEAGQHWADVIRAQMRKGHNQWCCPAHLDPTTTRDA